MVGANTGDANICEDGIERDGLRPGDVMVVTGGGGGFGRAFAKRFARAGAKIAVWDFNAESGGETVRQVQALGGVAKFFRVDLSEAAQIETAARDTLAAFGAP